MAVVNRSEISADLGEVAEAGIHLPEPTTVLSEGRHAEHDHDDSHEHEHGFEIIEVLRVVFVALAAAAVWFRLWEPFPHRGVIGLVARWSAAIPSSRKRLRISSSVA